MVENTPSVNVRQLCLQLKPILGSKMDKIYTAYLAEDKDGQQQIEHYLQLLAAEHLPSSLEQSRIVLLWKTTLSLPLGGRTSALMGGS